MELQEIKQTLGSFTGTEHYYIHRIAGIEMKLTDGCAYIRQALKAYWLFDLILSYQVEPKVRGEEFQVWKFEKMQNESMLVTCFDGNKNKLAVQTISYTDFPLDTLTVWYVQGIAMLPSEY